MTAQILTLAENPVSRSIACVAFCWVLGVMAISSWAWWRRSAGAAFAAVLLAVASATPVVLSGGLRRANEPNDSLDIDARGLNNDFRLFLVLLALATLFALASLIRGFFFRAPPICPICGSDLRVARTNACPECGAEREAKA